MNILVATVLAAQMVLNLYLWDQRNKHQRKNEELVEKIPVRGDNGRFQKKKG